MTEKQTKHYWRLWTAACAANGWRMRKGRLEMNDAAMGTEARLVHRHGSAIAATLHRGCTVDDLRHGAHVLILGRDKSSLKFTHADVDRIFRLFELLADPDNLTAGMAVAAHLAGENPASAERTAAFLETCKPDYVAEVCRDRFGTADWRGLRPEQQRILLRLLKARPNALPNDTEPDGPTQTQLASEDVPY